MESHRTEIEELEKVYREDCDRKEGEVYLLLQDKNRLQEEFEAFKFKVQMDESNREQEMALLKIKKGYPDSRM
jgi:branched-subunit amino acid aminotransferase/4-amino-4-deoxychorismate lyase